MARSTSERLPQRFCDRASDPWDIPGKLFPAFVNLRYIRTTTGNWRSENFHLARFAALSAAHE
jgi:hypothetical protein